MTTTITAGDEQNLQKQFGRSSFYLSAIVPRTLWEARITNSGRLLENITFDQGSGSAWSAVEAGQTVWVGSAPGKKDIGIFRIRNVTSGDSGVTGTVTIPYHPLFIVQYYYLTFVHDYQYDSRYPWIEWDDKTFKKDHDIAYSNQNNASNDPITPDIWFSQRAGKIDPTTGELVIWYDASFSKSWSGGTINSYSVSAYPTTGITIDNNSSTGKGKLVLTSTTIGYYWLKFTMSDTNGNTRTTYRAIYAHSSYKQDATYPIHNFSVGSYTKDWDAGGVSAAISFHGRIPDIISDPDDKAPDDMIDLANAILWKEPRIPLTTVRDDDLLLVDPQISHSPDISDWSMDIIIHAGVIISGQVAPDSTNVDLEVTVTGDATTYTPTGVVTDGMISVPLTIATPATSGTITVTTTTPVTVIAESYSLGDYITKFSEYPSFWLFRAQNLLVGYLGNDTITQDSDIGAGNDVYDLMSIERVMSMHYMFSVSLAASQSPGYWYEMHDGMTNLLGTLHLLEWHSNLFDVADFRDNTGNTDLRAYMEWTGQDIYTQADGMLLNTGIRAHLIADQDGRLHVTHNINWLPNDEKATLPTVTELNRNYYGGQIQITDRPMNQVALVYGDGMVWNGGFTTDEETGDIVPDLSGYCSIAQWFIPQRGGQSTMNLAAQTIRSQEHLDNLTGQVWADGNQPYAMTLTMKGDPSAVMNVHEQEYFQINVASGDNPKGLVLTDQLIILRTVTAQVDVANGTMAVSTNWEFDVRGIPGTAGICPDFLPTFYGYIPFKPAILPGSIVTGSDGGGVNLLPVDTQTWLNRFNAADQNTLFVADDPWWRIKSGIWNPSESILWRCGYGIIERSVNAGETWYAVTPTTDPPNDAGDSPAPTVGDLDFVEIEGSHAAINSFAAIATWTASGGERRSWLLHTIDDGQTWTWNLIFLTGGTISSYDTYTDLTEDWPTDNPVFYNYGLEATMNWVAKLSDDIYVYCYYEVAAPYQQYLRAYSRSSDLFGDRVGVGDTGDIGDISIVELSSSQFVAIYLQYDGTEGDYILYCKSFSVGGVPGLVITPGTEYEVPGPIGHTSGVGFWDLHIARIDNTHALITYGNSISKGSGGYCDTRVITITGGTITFGTEDEFTTDQVTQCQSILLTPTLAVTIWNKWLTGTTRDIRACLADISGTGITYRSTESTLVSDASDTPKRLHSTAVDSTRFLLSYVRGGTDGYVATCSISGDNVNIGTPVNYDSVTVYTGYLGPQVGLLSTNWGYVAYTSGSDWIIRLLALSGSSITAGSPATYSDVSGNYVPLPRTIDETELFVVMRTDDDATGDWYVRATIANVNLGDMQFDAKGLAISRLTGGHVYVTGTDGATLYLLKYSLPLLLPVSYWSLGAATFAQVDARTYCAWPYVQLGSDTGIVVSGRMNAPEGLSNPSHIIYSTDGSNFSVAEDGWSGDICSGLIMDGYGGVFAIRGTPSSATLYTGTLAGSMSSVGSSGLAYDTEHRGIDLDLRDGTIVIASRGANSIMVQALLHPYSGAWLDITYNHPNSYGINSLKIL